MKITTDTNVLISATFWEGDSDKIIQKVERKEIELILSKEIIEEFANALGYGEIQSKVKEKNLEMKRTVAKIVSLCTLVEPKKKLDIVKEDPDDNKIIEAANAGHSDYLITKDNHLLKLKEYGGIKILTPTDFLREINQ